MGKTSRIVAAFFGALLVVAFFLPWVEFSMGAVDIGISGYDLLRGATRLQKLAKSQTFSTSYFMLLLPFAGAMSILFSCLLPVPHLTLASAMGAVAYIAFRMADIGMDNVRHSLGAFGLGLWISLVCVLVIFITASVQAATGAKKK